MGEANYNDFCKLKGCPNYVEWDFATGEYGSIAMVSCMVIGQSENIERYPDDCLHLEEIKSKEVSGG